MFKIESEAGVRLPGILVGAAFFLSLGVALDLAQYVYLWDFFWRELRTRELRGEKPNDTVEYPRQAMSRADAVFIAKIVMTVLGQALIIIFLALEVFRVGASAAAS